MRDPPVLHQGARSPRTCARCTRSAAARPTPSTGTAGATTRWSARPTASTAPGSCSWKVYVKDGIITWETQQTDYPSVGPGLPGVRAPRLPARRGVLLVHLLADPGPLPLRPRRAAADVPRGQGRARRRPGRGVGGHRRTTRSGRARYKSARGKGGLVRATLGRGHRDRRRRARAHDQEVRARTGSPGFSPIPAMSMVSHAAGARFFSLHRRLDAVLLRLVRRPAGRLAAGVRRPDRRARSRATGGTPAT